MQKYVVAALLLCLSACSKPAQEPVVYGAWIRVAPPSSGVLAGYMTFDNLTAQNIRITAAQSPVFERVEFHHMSMEGKQMIMRQIPFIEAKAGVKAILEPGANHLMLHKPKQPAHIGDRLPVTFTLTYEDGQQQLMNVEFLVRGRPPQ